MHDSMRQNNARPQCLAPSLRPGDIVAIDNLRAHIPNEERQIIKAAALHWAISRPTAPTTDGDGRAAIY